jgi:hypothetical protein
MNEDELQRLDADKQPPHVGQGIGTVSLLGRCGGNAADVLLKTKEVLRTVLHVQEPWPSVDQWRGLLPEWFLESCSPEMSDAEKEVWRTWWSTQSEPERQRFTKEAPWRLSAWAYAMHPTRRTWNWWNGKVMDCDLLEVELDVREWPTALGSISWLLRAAGARQVLVKG